jgi:hypothetical protein
MHFFEVKIIQAWVSNSLGYYLGSREWSGHPNKCLKISPKMIFKGES